MMVVDTSRRPAVTKALRRVARPSVLDLVVIALLAVAYNVIRGTGGDDAFDAFEHAASLVNVEGWVFPHIEVPLNAWTSGVPIVAVASCYFYAVVHYVATPTVLITSWRTGGWAYRRGYLTLVLASGIALVIYAKYPVAPPRLVPGDGVVDVMRQYAAYGWWGDAASAPRGIGDATNQYAALPSLHCGWAVWCGLQMKDFRSRRWRILAWAYPLTQAFVVIATGNHYVIDVLAGSGLVIAAHLLVDQVGKKLGRTPEVAVPA